MFVIPSIIDRTNFRAQLKEYYLSTLKHEVILHILQEREEDFFDLDKFFRQNQIKSKEIQDLLIKKITDELHHEGWKTFLGFGDTGLFIYSTEEKPKNAF